MDDKKKIQDKFQEKLNDLLCSIDGSEHINSYMLSEVWNQMGIDAQEDDAIIPITKCSECGCIINCPDEYNCLITPHDTDCTKHPNNVE